MAQFSVTAAELRNKAEQLRQQNEQFKTLSNDLKDKENGLSGMWEGDARNTFRNEFQRSASYMDNFHNGINQYIQALEQIIRKYEEAEAKNVEIAGVKA